VPNYRYQIQDAPYFCEIDREIPRFSKSYDARRAIETIDARAPARCDIYVAVKSSEYSAAPARPIRETTPAL